MYQPEGTFAEFVLVSKVLAPVPTKIWIARNIVKRRENAAAAAAAAAPPRGEIRPADAARAPARHLAARDRVLWLCRL